MVNIKARGKKENTGEWVHDHYIAEDTPAGTRHIICYSENGLLFFPTVIPETVGQYTRLKDDSVDEDNRREIYEGSIVSGTKNGWTREFEVIWDDDQAGFIAREIGYPSISFDLTKDNIIDLHVVVITRTMRSSSMVEQSAVNRYLSPQPYMRV